MDDVRDSIEKYLRKLESFVACFVNKNWISDANEANVDILFDIALEIQSTLSSNEAGRLREIAERLHPGYDFSQSVNMLLEALFLHPNSKEPIILHVFKKYVTHFSKQELSELLLNLLLTKRLKDDSIFLINYVKNEKLMKVAEAKLIAQIWEEKLLNWNGDEADVVQTFTKVPSLFLRSLKELSYPVGERISKVIINHVGSLPDDSHWFCMLNSENIDSTCDLCNRFPVFLTGLLGFLHKIASNTKDFEDDFCLNDGKLIEFSSIIRSLLLRNDKVSLAVDDLITKAIYGLDKNFSFWLTMKSSLVI